MGFQETQSPPHLYPQALQLKLYQAFIFSIPILFSIILFLLFYLFYLKRRASSLSSSPPMLPRSLNQSSSFTQSPFEFGLKGNVIEKLPKVSFDEELGARDSQCCVCLGEFETKEELIQVPSCKHVFHVICIQSWLRTSLTCPLCRCSVISPTKHADIQVLQNTRESPNSGNADLLRDAQAILVEEASSSSSTSSLRVSGRGPELPLCRENNNMNYGINECQIHM